MQTPYDTPMARDSHYLQPGELTNPPGFSMPLKAGEDVPTMSSEGKSTEQLTKERGSVYGPPIEHFDTVQAMYQPWLERFNKDAHKTGLTPAQANSLRHGVYMICDKLVRMGRSPGYQDNYADVKGYARTIELALGLAEG